VVPLPGPADLAVDLGDECWFSGCRSTYVKPLAPAYCPVPPVMSSMPPAWPVPAFRF
jgi:hypothetical protein